MSTNTLNRITLYMLIGALALFVMLAGRAAGGERRDLTGITVNATNRNAAANRRARNRAVRRLNPLNQSASAVAGYATGAAACTPCR